MNKHFYTITSVCLILIVLIWEVDRESAVRLDWGNIHEEMPLAALLLWLLVFGVVVYLLNMAVHRTYQAQLRDVMSTTEKKKHLESVKEEQEVLDRAEIDNAMIELVHTMTSITEGDMPTARKALESLKKRTGSEVLTDILMLKIYQGEHDFENMEKLSKKLENNPDLKLVSLKATIEAQIEKKDYEKALKAANKAYETRQDLYWIIHSAYTLRAKTDDWAGAMEVLETGYKNDLVGKERYLKLKGTTFYEMALQAKDKGDAINFFKYCKQAFDTDASLVPAALDLAQYYVENDNQIRQAEQVLKKAWCCNPTSDVAEAYLDLYPNETAVQKVQRMEKWAPLNTFRPSLNNILLAELDIKAELWGKARAEFEIFLINNPATKKMSRLIAEFEEKSNKNEKAAETWRQKAPDCQSDAVWMCESCRHVSAKWLPICKKCGQVGTYSWRLYKRQKIEENENGHA